MGGNFGPQIVINGVRHWLWRAVDSNGEVLDILVQSRRSARAAKRFISRLSSRWSVPRVIVKDTLRSDGAAQAKAREDPGSVQIGKAGAKFPLCPR
jgi:putative transposase